MLSSERPWKSSSLVDHVIWCDRRSQDHTPTWPASSAERNDSSLGGKAAPGSATWLPAGSAWSSVSGTFKSTVRQFCLILQRRSQQRATAFRKERLAYSNASFRSNRVGRAATLCQAHAALRKPCGGAANLTPKTDLLLIPARAVKDRRERKTV